MHFTERRLIKIYLSIFPYKWILSTSSMSSTVFQIYTQSIQKILSCSSVHFFIIIITNLICETSLTEELSLPMIYHSVQNYIFLLVYSFRSLGHRQVQFSLYKHCICWWPKHKQTNLFIRGWLLEMKMYLIGRVKNK